MDVIPQRNLLGYNFNRYYSPQSGIPNPRIDLRLNLANDESLASIRGCLEGFVRDGRITHFSAEPQPWKEPEFVVEAHEVATACALQFVDGVRDSDVLMGALTANATEFMLHFFTLLFDSIGLHPYVVWGILRTQPPEGLTQVVQSCAALLEPVFRRQTRRADFLERFMHLLPNCTVSGTDIGVVNALLVSQFYKTLAHG